MATVTLPLDERLMSVLLLTQAQVSAAVLLEVVQALDAGPTQAAVVAASAALARSLAVQAGLLPDLAEELRSQWQLAPMLVVAPTLAVMPGMDQHAAPAQPQGQPPLLAALLLPLPPLPQRLVVAQTAALKMLRAVPQACGELPAAEGGQQRLCGHQQLPWYLDAARE